MEKLDNFKPMTVCIKVNTNWGDEQFVNKSGYDFFT